jgi:hypothetical protein
MKVTSQPNIQAGAPDKTGKIRPPQERESSPPPGRQAGVTGSAPSFQSVLDKVIQSPVEGETGRRPDEAPQKESPPTKQRAEGNEPPKDVRVNDDLPEEELPNHITQTTVGDFVSARELRIENQLLTPREILPITDLEKMILSVRTHLVPGGQPQVSLALPNSLLEGLRVNLSVSQEGRVTAEFLAPSEAIKSQIEARSNDLADLLRARGVTLEALKTSLSTELSGNGDGRNRRGYPPAVPSVGAGRKPSPQPAAEEPEMAEARVAEPLSGITYRA